MAESFAFAIDTNHLAAIVELSISTDEGLVRSLVRTVLGIKISGGELTQTKQGARSFIVLVAMASWGDQSPRPVGHPSNTHCSCVE